MITAVHSAPHDLLGTAEESSEQEGLLIQRMRGSTWDPRWQYLCWVSMAVVPNVFRDHNNLHTQCILSSWELFLGRFYRLFYFPQSRGWFKDRVQMFYKGGDFESWPWRNRASEGEKGKPLCRCLAWSLPPAAGPVPTGSESRGQLSLSGKAEKLGTDSLALGLIVQHITAKDSNFLFFPVCRLGDPDSPGGTWLNVEGCLAGLEGWGWPSWVCTDLLMGLKSKGPAKWDAGPEVSAACVGQRPASWPTKKYYPCLWFNPVHCSGLLT